MPTRVSGLSSFILFSRSLAERGSEMVSASEKLTSLKRVNRPSDDPEGAKLLLSMRRTLKQNEQYKSNLELADRQFQMLESVMQQMNDLITRTEEIAIQGRGITLAGDSSGGPLPEEIIQRRASLAEEIQQLQQQMRTLANTKLSGDYLFSGYKTNVEPFTLSNNGSPPIDNIATYNGDSNLKSIQIGDGIDLEIQVDGEEMFMGTGNPDNVDIFQTFADVERALRDGSRYDDIPALIDDLNTARNQVMGELTNIGARANRVSVNQDQLATQKEIFSTFISEIEDVDLAEITMEFQKAQIALQATIGSASSVLNIPTLMDFIGR